MIKLIETLIGFVLVTEVVSAGLFQSPIKKIEEALKERLPNNLDLQANLNVTLKLREELAKDPTVDNAVLEILSTIEDMNEFLDNPQCDEKMYVTVDQVIDIVGSRCLIPNKTSDLTRLHGLVRYLATDIAKKCHRIHKKKLFTRLGVEYRDDFVKVMDLGQMCYMTDLVFKRAETCLRDVKERDLTELLDNILPRMRERDNPEFKYLRTVTDEKGSKIVQEDKVDELVKDYMTEPCRNIESKVSDLIPIAQRATRILSASDSAFKRGISPFKTLVPALCVCHVFAMAGDDAVVRKAIKLVPKAEDIEITYLEGFTEYRREHEGLSNSIKDLIEWYKARFNCVRNQERD